MDLSPRDFKDLSDLGQALWVDARHSERAAIDSVAAMALQEGGEFFERVSRSLLRRAATEGPGATAERIHDPYFRLPPEERLTLMALHRGRWGYARLARLLRGTPESVQELAWGARLHLAMGFGSSQSGARVRAAPGSPRSGRDCPEYHPGRPWTQRFLDDELSPRERLFVQSHATHCDSCRQSLLHARHLYYAVDAIVPRSDERREQSLVRAVRRLRIPQGLAHLTFMESLKIFGRRPDVRVALLVLAGVTLLWLAR